jgi:dynein light chain Tctex-type 1
MAEESFGVEEKAFVCEEVNGLLKESVESTLANAPYHHNKVAQWNSNIVELSLKKLTSLNKPFKYIGTYHTHTYANHMRGI